jgi:hypothetical protein
MNVAAFKKSITCIYYLSKYSARPNTGNIDFLSFNGDTGSIQVSDLKIARYPFRVISWILSRSW